MLKTLRKFREHLSKLFKNIWKTFKILDKNLENLL